MGSSGGASASPPEGARQRKKKQSELEGARALDRHIGRDLASETSITRARAERLFGRLDLDGDGEITVAELCAVMERAGLSPQSALVTAAHLLDKTDVDHSRTIDLGEFVGYFLLEEVQQGRFF